MLTRDAGILVPWYGRPQQYTPSAAQGYRLFCEQAEDLCCKARLHVK